MYSVPGCFLALENFNLFNRSYLHYNEYLELRWTIKFSSPCKSLFKVCLLSQVQVCWDYLSSKLDTRSNLGNKFLVLATRMPIDQQSSHFEYYKFEFVLIWNNTEEEMIISQWDVAKHLWLIFIVRNFLYHHKWKVIFR